jgi:cation-transporting ATPase E
VSAHTTAGHRVLILAHTPTPLTGDRLPAGLVASGIVVFEERLRPGAARTISYLQQQGVAVKVLSGDSPATVAVVATRVGVREPGGPVDARTLPSDADALGSVLEASSVFGRVQPHQKRDAVLALRARGHVVAMTGDGINDIPALKAADIGMAMGSGSPATRAAGRLVLMDSDFEVVPWILGEGRRVIANVERVANLFVTKTVYAALFALAIGLSGLPYPFFPRHLTVVSSLTIGVPSFFLALAPGAPRARPGYVGRVLRFAVPAGVVTGSATLGLFVLTRNLDATTAQARTVATWSLLALGLVVLTLVARPLRPLRVVLVLAMAGGAALVSAEAWSRRIFALGLPPRASVAWAALIVAVAALLLVAAVTLTPRLLGEHGTAGRFTGDVGCPPV